MSDTANWIALGINGAFALATFFTLFPTRRGSNFDEELAWGWLVIAYVIGVFRFLAEAAGLGFLPAAPAPPHTNWIRYVGGGLSSVAFLSTLCALSRGGVTHFLQVAAAVFLYYLALVGASVWVATHTALLGFYIISCAIFVAAIVSFIMLNRSTRRYKMIFPILAFLLEAAFIASAGIELFKRTTLPTWGDDWLFFSVNIAQCIWYMFIYLGGVEAHWLSSITEASPADIFDAST